MANCIYLDSKNMPNSKFKFSKVDQKTIGISGNIDTQINNYASHSSKIVTNFKDLSTLLKRELTNNRKKYDTTTYNNLDKLSKGVASQADYVEKRVKAIKELIQRDTKSLKQKAEKAAWRTLLDALLKDPNLSDATKSAISDFLKQL